MNGSDHVMAGYWGVTHLHPIAVVGLVVTGLAAFLMDRRSVPAAILPILVLVAAGQRLVIGGVDFGILRMLGVLCLTRFIVKGEAGAVKWGLSDFLVFGVGLLPAACAVLRGDDQKVMMSTGMGFDLISMYLVGRICLDNEEAWFRMIMVMGVLSLPIAGAFLLEKFTARNLFAIFGGVPEVTRMRFGKLRAQGAFSHPIMAGAWFVTFLPLYFGMLRAPTSRTQKFAAIAGLLASIFLIFAVDSGTAVAGAAVAVLLIMLYHWRWPLGRWRWFVFAAVILHFVSKSGLHGLLFTRISFVSGSTGYHRYRLYDAAIDRFGEWFFIGTNGTAHWGWHLFDVTSEYVAMAVRGGAVCLAMFVALQASSLRGLSASAKQGGLARRVLAFHIGAAVALQAFMMLSVSYFGQIVFLMGAMVGGAVALARGHLEQSTAGGCRITSSLTPCSQRGLLQGSWGQ